MAQIRAQDRTIFTAAEPALIQASSRSEITVLRSSQLHIASARTLSEKSRKLTRFQHRARKMKQEGVRFANARTERKARMLEEVLVRFEKHRAQLDKQGQERQPRITAQADKAGFPTAQQRQTIRREKQQRRAADESTRESRVTRQFQKTRISDLRACSSPRRRRLRQAGCLVNGHRPILLSIRRWIHGENAS